MFLMFKYNWFYMYIMILNLVMFLCMNTFFSMWLMMELNLLIFLILLILNNNFLMDKLMKYYLINSSSSMIFFYMLNLNFFSHNYLMIVFMNLCMMMKLGVMPFHLWFIDLMMNINWLMCFLLSTLQKLIPMIFLMFFFNKNLLIFLSIFSGMLSLFMIFNQIMLKKLMGYSSINHMSWMIMSIMISLKLFFLYYLSYLFINFMIMYKNYILNINEIMEINNFNFLQKLYLMLLFFSLGGLPPFFGFMMKWFMIIYLTLNKMLNFLMILILYSLTFLYFYMRLFLNILMMNFLNIKINFFYFNIYYNNFMKLMNIILIINLLMFFMFIYL